MKARWSRRDVGLVLLAILWLGFTIGFRPLTLPDEGRYVSVAWAMISSGNWLYPTLGGLPFFDKPPLFYWITATGIGLLGRNLWAARLAPLVAAALIVVLVHGFALRQAGVKVARWTLLVLATSPLFFGGAQFASMDLLVAAFITATTLLAAEAAINAAAGQPYKARLASAYACAGLGFLAKGLIGAVLPGGTILAWLLVNRRLAQAKQLLWLPGILLFLVVSAPWMLAVQGEFPGFVRYFIVYEHFQRYLEGGFNNPQPFWFYLPVLAVGLLPWTYWLIKSARRDWRIWSVGPVQSLMWLWVAVVTVFFSIPHSKMVGYILPVVPPLAFLTAAAIARQHGEVGGLPAAVRRAAIIGASICLLAVAGYVLFIHKNDRALAAQLEKLRHPNEPIAFLGTQFFDVPYYMGLREPVVIADRWDLAAKQGKDDWHKAMAVGAAFDPELGKRLLISPKDLLRQACNTPTTWIIAQPRKARELVSWLDSPPDIPGPYGAAWQVTGDELARQGDCPQRPRSE